MNVEERQAFLADLHVGIVSIARKQKGPLTVPIWYDYEPGGEVWMITNESSIKGKLLGNASRISLCVQTEAAPYQYVSVEGPFTIGPTEEGQLLHMAIRYLGPYARSDLAVALYQVEYSSLLQRNEVIEVVRSLAALVRVDGLFPACLLDKVLCLWERRHRVAGAVQLSATSPVVEVQVRKHDRVDVPRRKPYLLEAL